MSSPVESLPEPLAFTIRDWFFVVVGVAAATLTPGPFAGAWFMGYSWDSRLLSTLRVSRIGVRTG